MRNHHSLASSIASGSTPIAWDLESPSEVNRLSITNRINWLKTEPQ